MVASSTVMDYHFSCQLWADGTAAIDLAAFMEAMTDHALGKQKKDDCQDDYKKEASDSERVSFVLKEPSYSNEQS